MANNINDARQREWNRLLNTYPYPIPSHRTNHPCAHFDESWIPFLEGVLYGYESIGYDHYNDVRGEIPYFIDHGEGFKKIHIKYKTRRLIERNPNAEPYDFIIVYQPNHFGVRGGTDNRHLQFETLQALFAARYGEGLFNGFHPLFIYANREAIEDVNEEDFDFVMSQQTPVTVFGDIPRELYRIPPRTKILEVNPGFRACWWKLLLLHFQPRFLEYGVLPFFNMLNDMIREYRQTIYYRDPATIPPPIPPLPYNSQNN